MPCTHPAALLQVGMLQFKDLNADRTAFQRTCVAVGMC